MKIKMLKTSAGPQGVMMAGRTYPDVPEDEAKALVEAGAAVSLEPKEKPKAPGPETASVEPAQEKAVKPKAKPKKKSK